MESGQALTEFVLVMLPMLILLLLAIQYLLIWRADSCLQLAAYTAARKFAVDAEQDVAENAAMFYLKNIVSEDRLTFNFPEDTPDFAVPFNVSLTMQYPLLGVPLVQHLFTSERTIVTKWGNIQTVEGTDPPTAASLGLGPDQELELMGSKPVGKPVQKYSWSGRIDLKFVFYGQWDPKDIDDYHQWNDEFGNDFYHWLWGPIIQASEPTPEQLAGDWLKPQLVTWHDHPNVLRALYGAWLDGVSQTPVGTPKLEYIFTYRILTIKRQYKPDPNAITLTAGAVMNKESGLNP